MSKYSRILLAVDQTEDCHCVAQQAMDVARLYGAELHIVHVIEPQSLAYGDEIPMDLSVYHEYIHEQAQSYLSEFSKQYDISERNQHLVFGRIDSEIQRIAEKDDMDAIVVGSHGRHGLAILFGSNLDGVLNRAPCDVLVVRIDNADS